MPARSGAHKCIDSDLLLVSKRRGCWARLSRLELLNPRLSGVHKVVHCRPCSRFLLFGSSLSDIFSFNQPYPHFLTTSNFLLSSRMDNTPAGQ